MDRDKWLVLLVGGASVVAGVGVAWWFTRGARRPLGIARLAPGVEVPPGCPLLAVEDPAVRQTEFWDHAMVDPTECPVRGLDIAKLPKHVRPFAEFMVSQSKKDLSPRDIAKAYLLTVSSVQRSAIGASTLRRTWPSSPFRGRTVRPEDAMGAILETPTGKRYLDAAVRGTFDKRDARIIGRWFAPFGLTSSLGKQLQTAPALARRSNVIGDKIRRDTPRAWSRYVEKDIPYIGFAKAGFFSALLGRGDLPTADAKELEFWLCRIGEWNTEKMRCKSHARTVIDPPPDRVMREFQEALAGRLADMKVKMPKRYQPFYQHLTHHAVWDRIGKTETTHQDMIDAMKNA